MEISLFFTLGSGLVLIAFIWKLFEKAEAVASLPLKKAISDWLLNLEVKGEFSNWRAAFGTVFDRIFGERHFSWRCFSRSCLASIVTVSILFLFWVGQTSDDPHTEITDILVSRRGLTYFYINLLLLYVICNFLPDYVSLLKTRRIIGILSTPGSFLRIPFWLFIDAIGSTLIALVALAVFFLFIGEGIRHRPGYDLPLRTTQEILWWLLVTFRSDMLRLSNFPGIAGVFVYSTFFTSVWLWLYAFSGSLIKLGEYVGWGLSRFKATLDIRGKPLLSLGIISCGVVTFLYILVLLFKRTF
jgi:hypothetical protein